MRTKRADFWIITIWPFLASILSFVLNANMLFSSILFFGAPAIYLSIRNYRKIIKTFLFAAVLGFLLSIITDYIMARTGGWNFPTSVFPRLFGGYVTVEQIIWIFLYIYFVVIFYETFLDRDNSSESVRPNLKYLFLITTAVFALFVLLYALKPNLLKIDYFYLRSGIILAIIPLAAVLFSFPNLYKKFSIAAAYFFFFSLIYELTGLALGHWEFLGKNQYVGMVEVFGLRFPIEELFFWIILGAMGILAYYEFFDDDKQ